MVEICHQNGINAVGLTGVDGALIRGKRNRGIKTIQEGRKMILRDLSGKPRSINRELLDLLLNNGYTPVITVPIIDEENQAVNSENDDILSLIHGEFRAARIFQFIEAPGFLKDPDNQDSLIETLTHQELSKWEETVTGRIKRKLMALKKLQGIQSTRIHIADGRVAHPLAAAMSGSGTVIS
jgi:acetylglutamate/LysW-gamma-L-alpha-aminoadipate kinase